jgi:hypothetical protein
MGGDDFFRTRMGARFFDVTVPKIADQLERLVKAFEAYVAELRRANDRAQAASAESADRAALGDERWMTTLTTIAREQLSVETLEERGAEWLDVHDIKVEHLRKALGTAFRAGLAAGIRQVIEQKP